MVLPISPKYIRDTGTQMVSTEHCIECSQQLALSIIKIHYIDSSKCTFCNLEPETLERLLFPDCFCVKNLLWWGNKLDT